MKYLYLLLVLLLIPLVSAIPEIPHQFYGSVSGVSSGSVSVRLCNEQFSVPIVNGNYGLSEPLLVEREDCSGNTIEFYVNGEFVKVYNFISGGYTFLNLDVPIIEVQNNLVVNNPVVDNTPDTNDDSNDGEDRDTSHIKPSDFLFDSNDKQEDVEDDEIGEIKVRKNSMSTGKVIYDTLTKTKPGVVAVGVGSGIGLLGLIYLLKLVLLR